MIDLPARVRRYDLHNNCLGGSMKRLEDGDYVLFEGFEAAWNALLAAESALSITASYRMPDQIRQQKALDAVRAVISRNPDAVAGGAL